jgi:dipeptidyl aminopeptidase/acylaminoacyl peptidase
MKKTILVLVLILSIAMAQTIPEPRDIFRTPPFYGNTPSSICWSAGDSAVAFIWNQDGYRYGDIWTIDIPSGKLQQLTDYNRRNSDNPANAVQHIAWFPNRQRLLFCHQGNIFTIDLKSSDQIEAIAMTDDEELAPQISPDGRYIAFLRNDILQLYDIKHKQIRALSQPINGCWQDLSLQSLFFWSPDASTLIIPDYEGSYCQELLLFDIRKNSPERLVLSDEQSLIVRDLIWIPEQEKIAIDYLTADVATRSIIVVDLKTRNMETLYSRSAELWCSDFGGKLFWLEPEKKILFGDTQNSYPHLFTVGLDLKNALSITRGKWCVFDYTVGGSDGQIYFSANKDQRSERQIYTLDRKTDNVITLSYLHGCHDFVLASSGCSFIDIYSNAATPPCLYVTNTSPVSKAQIILKPDTRVPYAAHLKTALNENIRGADSETTIPYRLWYPDGHLGANKYPLIIYVDCNQKPVALLDEWSVSTLIAQWLSSIGYVVVEIDYPPASRIASSDPWKIQIDAINSVIDKLAENEFIDMSRIGIAGFHYNAYLSLLAMLELPERVKVCAGITSENFWDPPIQLYDKLLFKKIAAISKSPDLDSTDITRLLTGQLLLIQGASSTLQPLLNTEATLQQLVNQKKRVDFVFYPWEGNVLRTDQTYIDIMEKLREFFDRNL